MSAGPPTTEHTPRKPPGRIRRIFRRVRIALLLIVLLFTAFALWCNFVRVPSFITSLVRQELRSKNIALEFSRLRLKGFRRLVAEDVQVSAVNSTNGPLARIDQAEILLDRHRLKAGEFQISGVRVEGGEFAFPLRESGMVSRTILVTNIQSEVEFLPGGTLRIAGFSASALGARATASGTLRNFARIKMTAPGEGGSGKWEEQAAEILRIAEQLRFETPPVISLNFSADATNFSQMRASLLLRAERTRSRWGALRSLRLMSGMYPAGSNSAVKAAFLFDLEGLRGRSNRLDALHLSADTVFTPDFQRLISNRVSLQITNLISPGFSTAFLDGRLASMAENSGEGTLTMLDLETGGTRVAPAKFTSNSFSATLRHGLPFSSPASLLAGWLSGKRPPPPRQQLTGEWHLNSSGVDLPRWRAETLDLRGGLRFDQSATNADESLLWWADLAPFQIPWHAVLQRVVAQEIAVDALEAAGEWSFPSLSVTNLEARLLEGSLKASGSLDVTTRRAALSLESGFEYHGAAALLDEPVQQWLGQFTWDTPPAVQAVMRAQLPPWNAAWRSREIASTLDLNGRLDGAMRFRGAPLDRLKSDFQFRDFLWRLPNLEIAQGTNRALVHYLGNATNASFHCSIDSGLDPGAFRDLFSSAQQIVFDFVKFADPPRVRGELEGNLDDPKSLVFKGELSATNFFVKEQLFSDIRAGIGYSNLVVECTDVLGHRGREEVRAPWLRVDITNEVMFVTNVVSTIDPWVAMSLVGEDAYNAIDPYRFASTPTVTINGNVPLRHWSKANLHFGVSGQDFSFWRFHMPSLSGDVYWRANYLNFSNVVANFYNGRATWSAAFVIDPDPRTNNAHFSFTAHTTNSDLRLFVRDVFALTNQMEGVFSGDLVITGADSMYPRSWNGYGKANLRDGFLWNVPIFGVFSPILDSIVPGLGASRLNSGTGSFKIKDSVIYTDDMQVRAPAFRLNYKGKVDLDGKLDARVEAEILRDAWVVGKVFSMALWPVAKAFEAKVTGQLDNPKTTLRFFPKFVFAPFKALNALGEAVREKQPKNPGPEANPPNPPEPAKPLEKPAQK